MVAGVPSGGVTGMLKPSCMRFLPSGWGVCQDGTRYHSAGMGRMTGPAQAAEMWWPLALLLVVVAAALSAGLIVVLLPALRRHALARPNARSSHVEPTPQGGGIAVVVAIAIVALAAVTLTSPPGERVQLAWVLGAAALIAAVGAVDDMRAIPVLPRLLLQALAVAVVIAALPAELRVVPALPWWLERAFLALAALWFVNLVNFMDGIDWMTVAETVPVAGGLVVTDRKG